MEREATGVHDIELVVQDGIAVAWFNRPHVLNAFRSVTFDRLHAVLDQVAAMAEAQALVLTGRGRAFCAGEDLAEMDDNAGRGFTVRGAMRELTRLQDLTRRLISFRKPVVAAINGPAVGLGAELPLACPIRLAAPTAYFFFSEPRRGMLPTNGTFHFLPGIIGHGRAAEWLFTARRIPAAEAHAAGLLSEVTPDANLVSRAVTWAGRLAGRTNGTPAEAER